MIQEKDIYQLTISFKRFYYFYPEFYSQSAMDGPLKIAVDFDGTIVEHKYPEIGKEVMFAIQTLKALQEQGHQLILWTYRSGKELDEAVEFAESSPAPELDEATTDVYAEASAVVDKTSQAVTSEAKPGQDLVRKYWEETEQ